MNIDDVSHDLRAVSYSVNEPKSGSGARGRSFGSAQTLISRRAVTTNTFAAMRRAKRCSPGYDDDDNGDAE